MSTQAKSLDRAVLFALSAHLKQFMPSIKEVYEEFPDPSSDIQTPSLSISLGAPTTTPLDPYIWDRDPVTPGNQAKVRYITEMAEYNLQIDLWCRDKFERFQLKEEFRKAMNPDVIPMGLRLVLENYWNVICQYLQTGHAIDDNEAGSQRAERRATINLVANTKAVLEKDEYIITKPIETKLEMPDN